MKKEEELDYYTNLFQYFLIPYLIIESVIILIFIIINVFNIDFEIFKKSSYLSFFLKTTLLYLIYIIFYGFRYYQYKIENDNIIFNNLLGYSYSQNLANLNYIESPRNGGGYYFIFEKGQRNFLISRHFLKDFEKYIIVLADRKREITKDKSQNIIYRTQLGLEIKY